MECPETVASRSSRESAVYADDYALPLQDGCADIVFLVDVLECLRTPLRYRHEVVGCSKKRSGHGVRPIIVYVA